MKHTIEVERCQDENCQDCDHAENRESPCCGPNEPKVFTYRELCHAQVKVLEWVQNLEGMDPGGVNENMQSMWDAIEAKIKSLS